MITSHQIRAARAILDWGAERLAEEANLNRDTIHNIENGKVQPRGASAEKIMQVFVDHGIEFIGERGVALLNENYRILEGPDCYLRLLDEVYQTLMGKKNAEALFICVDDAISSKEVIKANLYIRNSGIKCRYLCPEKAVRFDFDPNDYRCIPEKFYTNSVMIVFGNKVATLRETNDAVMIVADREQADMLRGLFEMIWLQAKKPKINGVK